MMESVDLSHLRPLEAAERPIWRRSDLTPKIWHRQDGLVVRDVTPDLDPFVIQFLARFYVKDEPMNQALKVAEDPLAIGEQCAIWSKFILNQRVSLVVLKGDTPGSGLEKVSENNPPEIIGLNLLYVTSKKDPPLPDFGGTLKSEKVKICFTAFFRTGALADVFEKYNVDRYLDGSGMYVIPDWRGKGVGRMLLEGRKELCKALSIPATKSVFTSNQCQQAAQEYGFELLGEQNYTDCLLENGQLFFPDMDPGQEKMQLLGMNFN
ncbi:uncharacterized protein LOC132192460 isoform X2 [Neocloeon triangulifer]|uniref:uncharacterized protein LOC132192460 isoform X2 n=1 Tax=Neocloeon triangulifer TaxID=2078957 RepID=UPI00286EE45D|nr:uncharacterized protein LOC132192460 isoform X2 [Neocloeon triangulifer]